MGQNHGRRALFLDRDGVINEPPLGARYITAPDQLHLMEGAAEGIERFRRQGYTAIVVTNQRCVAAGLISHDILNQIHERMRDLLRAQGTNVEDILVCPHSDHGRCECRKPKAGLLSQAAQKHAICLADSILIGDSERDIAAGQTAGCRTILLGRTPGDDWAHVADSTAMTWSDIHPLSLMAAKLVMPMVGTISSEQSNSSCSVSLHEVLPLSRPLESP